MIYVKESNKIYSNEKNLKKIINDITVNGMGLLLKLVMDIKDSRNLVTYATYKDLADKTNINYSLISSLLYELEEFDLIKVIEYDDKDEILIYVNPCYYFRTDSIEVETIDIFYGNWEDD